MFTLTLEIHAVFTLCVHVGVPLYQLHPIFMILHCNMLPCVLLIVILCICVV